MDPKAFIQNLMKTNGYSKYRLAKESKMAYTTIENLIRRNKGMKIEQMEAICKVFGVKYVIGEEEDD